MKEFVRKYYLYGLAGMVCFFGGAYVWKVAYTGEENIAVSFYPGDRSPQRTSVLVEIGDTAITNEDLEFEFSLHTREVLNSEELTPIPDLGSRYVEELSPLREGLLSAMIERKLLYKYIQEHSKFDLEDPKRFTRCLEEWQKTLNQNKADFSEPGDRERLKQRLCERDILEQYLTEIVYPSLKVTKEEIQEYYDAHQTEFEKPRRVLIRQIVLPDEESAKKARHGLTRSNFASRAKELSITPEAAEGGVLGPFSKEEIPRVFNIAFTMRKGDIYGILKSTYGFHLIMLEDKLPAKKLSLTEAEPEIVEKLLQAKKEESFQEWIETALDTVQVSTPKPLW